MAEYQTKTTGNGMAKYETGAQRDSAENKGRYDLIPPEALKRDAALYERGAKKYNDRNWEKGIPASRCLDSMLRHAQQALDNFAKVQRGEAVTDPEDHLAAVRFNAACLATYEERGMIDRFIGEVPAKKKEPEGECGKAGELTAQRILDAIEAAEYRRAQYSVAGQVNFIPDHGDPRNKQETQVYQDHLWRRTIIYISGPMTNGGGPIDWLKIGEGVEAGVELMKDGYAVIMPQLTAYTRTALAWAGKCTDVNCGLDYSIWLDMDNALVAVSDAVLRISGPSKGADMEINMAKNLGKPVYHTAAQVRAFVGRWTKQTLSSKALVKNATKDDRY